MSYQVSTEEIESISDSRVGGYAMATLFVAVTGVIYGLLATRTTLLTTSDFVQTLTQLAIGGIVILLIALYANYRILALVEKRARDVIYWSYAGFIMFIVGLPVLGGAFMIAFGNFGGIFFIILGLIIAFFAWLFWNFISSRIDLAAQWLTVAANVVMNEPGMIVISLVKSIILFVGAITEFILIIVVQYVNEGNYSDDQINNMINLITFGYVWFTFFVLYYFDGVNVFMSYARIKGADPTIGQGISASTRRIPSIFLYALVSTIVTVIASILRGNRGSRRGSLDVDISSSKDLSSALFSLVFGSLLSFLASIGEWLYFMVNFFTLPIIIIRKKGVFSAMSESFNHFKQSMWNVVISNMAFGWGVRGIYLLVAVLTGFFGFIYGLVLSLVYSNQLLIGSGIGIAFLTFIVGLFITKIFVSPLYTAFTTTIYVYASEGAEAVKNAPQELVSEIDRFASSTPSAIIP